VGLLQHVEGQLSRLVALARARAHLVLGELTHGVHDQLLLFVGLEVDHPLRLPGSRLLIPLKSFEISAAF
jgi:hypothetical protein